MCKNDVDSYDRFSSVYARVPRIYGRKSVAFLQHASARFKAHGNTAYLLLEDFKFAHYDSGDESSAKGLFKQPSTTLV